MTIQNVILVILGLALALRVADMFLKILDALLTNMVRWLMSKFSRKDDSSQLINLEELGKRLSSMDPPSIRFALSVDLYKIESATDCTKSLFARYLSMEKFLMAKTEERLVCYKPWAPSFDEEAKQDFTLDIWNSILVTPMESFNRTFVKLTPEEKEKALEAARSAFKKETEETFSAPKKENGEEPRG